ncbi:MAG: hypothetical protein QXM50_00235 [Candidatus Caldarchaeum sp.]|uniref:Uncharacterized protein n=1 Tax=Caldiarchaeum subterraneum TaxID=311458 RepID=A0A7C4E1P1_CALS0|nr:hypothetical protein [Candidatus Caldarchaeales archaeon]MDJ0272196.1 hypothetical protein [Candidatus Caldarchaeales archaeon]
MTELSTGEYFGRGRNRRRILEVIRLSNGWILLKTENSKSKHDFKVRTVYQLRPRIRSYTPKHAHFAIDFYGKLCADKAKAMQVLKAIVEVWQGADIATVVERFRHAVKDLPGYDLEYILYALAWIFRQEDVNFAGRPESRQRELDETLNRLGFKVPKDRLGSQLALALLCNIANGMHPVDALLRANLDVLPIKRGKGKV